MINVRVRMWQASKELWTSAIRDPQALATLLPHLSRCGIKCAVYDDFGNANVADGCIAIGEQSGTLTWYTWGNHRFGCWLAPVPRAEGKLSWEGVEYVTPRDLAGPLPEEVAAHTPCACCDGDAAVQISAFDVHGSPERNAQAAAPQMVTVQPTLSSPTWWDRVLQLITGSQRGEAVRGQ